MICLMFSMLFRSIWQCSELLTFYWLPPPPPRPNSKNSARQFWHPIGWAPLTRRNWGSSRDQNFKWHYIYQHSRSSRPNGASKRKKLFYQFCLDLYGMTFIFNVIFCPMIFYFFFNLWPHTFSELYPAPPPPQVCSNLWWSVPPQVVLSLWYLW